MGHVATWVIASLRHEQFTSLDALRVAVYRQLDAYNAQPFQKRAGSRQSIFREEEQPLLRPLPVVPYEISTWAHSRKVAKSSYVTWKKNFYSVPLKHVGATVDLRITAKTLGVYLQSQRLSSHLLFDSTTVNQYRTNDADIPPERKYRAWDAKRIRGWAYRLGPNTVEVIDKIFASVSVTEQGINPALAVLRLSSKYGAPRLENACFVALQSRIRFLKVCALAPDLAEPAGRALERSHPPASGGKQHRIRAWKRLLLKGDPVNLNTETKRKLREMAAGDLLAAFEAQVDVVSMS